MPLVIADCTEQFEGGLQVISDLTDRGQVTAPVAVIGRTPHGYNILVVEMIFVAFVDQLVCSGDQREIVDMTELVCDSVSEEPSWISLALLVPRDPMLDLTCTPRADSPCLYIIWIRPH